MLDELSESFPEFGFFSHSEKKRLRETFILAGMNSRPEKYLSFSLVLSVSLAILSLLFLLLSFQFELSLAFSLLLFALIYLFMSKLPGVLAKRRGSAIEADLPMVLRSMAAELGMGISFEKALAHTAASNYAISTELRKAVQEADSGSSTPHALLGVCARVDSLMVKRAVQQMIESYKHGSKGEGLKHLADELIERQKASSREHNARVAFLGLLFIALSCVVPALFLAYVTVGSAFLSAQFSASDIWLIFQFGFPAANGLLLLVIYERTPKMMEKRKESIFSSKQARLADRVLTKKGFRLGFRKAMAYSVSFAAACSLVLLLLSSLLSFPTWFSLLPLIVPLLLYFLATYLVEKRASDIESRLPDALLQASSFPKGTPTDMIIRSIADSNYGPLSEEFAIANRQIVSGADIQSSLRSMANENDSLLLSRACELLSQAYASGGDMHKALKETAEDMFSIFSIVRERESALALQKYTLLFGGALLVPLVLGAIAGMVSSLNSPGLDLLSSLSAHERAELLAASISAAQAYLVAYSLLASLFIAQLGGSWRGFAPYLAWMAPVSLAVYSFTLNSRVLSLF